MSTGSDFLSIEVVGDEYVFEPGNPLHAAYHLGRCSNALLHWLRRSWIEPGGETEGQVRRLFGALRRVSLGIELIESSRRAFAVMIEEVESTWELHLNSLAYVEQLGEMLVALSVALSSGDADDRPQVAEAFRGMLRSMPELAWQIEDAVKEVSPRETQFTRMLALGRMVDQLVNPPQPERFYTAQLRQPQSAESGWALISSVEVFRRLEDRVVLEYRPPAPFPTVGNELQARLLELGFGEANIPIAQAYSGPIDFARAVDEAVANETRGVRHDDATAAEVGYLGIIIQTPHIRRIGVDASANLTGEIERNLFAFLVRQRDRFTSPEQLRNQWEWFGGDGLSGDSAIRAAISRLRGSIAPLVLTIENQRNIGWRLVARPSEFA